MVNAVDERYWSNTASGTDIHAAANDAHVVEQIRRYTGKAIRNNPDSTELAELHATVEDYYEGLRKANHDKELPQKKFVELTAQVKEDLTRLHAKFATHPESEVAEAMEYLSQGGKARDLSLSGTGPQVRAGAPEQLPGPGEKGNSDPALPAGTKTAPDVEKPAAQVQQQKPVRRQSL